MSAYEDLLALDQQSKTKTAAANREMEEIFHAQNRAMYAMAREGEYRRVTVCWVLNNESREMKRIAAGRAIHFFFDERKGWFFYAYANVNPKPRKTPSGGSLYPRLVNHLSPRDKARADLWRELRRVMLKQAKKRLHIQSA